MKELKDGEPCEHVGCQLHLTNPCENCGRLQSSGQSILHKND
jgi:hypothetical protein